MSEMIERVARAIARRHSGFPESWRDHELEARDAIEAMRMPTQAMIEAHGELGYVEGEGQDAIEAWQAMINAALKS